MEIGEEKSEKMVDWVIEQAEKMTGNYGKYGKHF